MIFNHILRNFTSGLSEQKQLGSFWAKRIQIAEMMHKW